MNVCVRERGRWGEGKGQGEGGDRGGQEKRRDRWQGREFPLILPLTTDYQRPFSSS